MSDEINVLSKTQLIYVEPSSGSVSIINAGPAGAGGGATGPQGVSIILKGTVGSFTALPTGAHSGDAYVTVDDGHIWVWNVVTTPGSPPTLARDSSSWSRHMPYIAANTDLVWGAIGPWPTLGPNRAISVTSPADIHKNWAEQVASNDFNVSAFTIGAWIWIPSGLGSGRTIFCNGGNISSVFHGYALAYNLNLDRLILAYGNSYIQSSGYVNRPGWHHVAVSHDGTTARFYIDAVLDSTVSWPRTPSTIPVGQSIGNLYPGEPLDQEWIGRLAGIFVSPSELSLATLSGIKNAISSAAYVAAVNATSPLGLWMLDEAIEATGWVDVGQLRGQQGPAGIPGEVGSAGFPITEDDGSNTYTIDVTSGILKLASSRDASGGDDVASVTAATAAYSDDSAAGLHASTASLNAEFQVMVSETLPNEPTFRFMGPYGIAQLVIGSGNPNTSGLNTAYKGSLYIDTGNAKLYQNTDGVAAWSLVGSSAPFLDLLEMSGPPPALADSMRLYSVDVAGVTTLRAKDGSGTIYTLAPNVAANYWKVTSSTLSPNTATAPAFTGITLDAGGGCSLSLDGTSGGGTGLLSKGNTNIQISAQGTGILYLLGGTVAVQPTGSFNLYAGGPVLHIENLNGNVDILASGDHALNLAGSNGDINIGGSPPNNLQFKQYASGGDPPSALAGAGRIYMRNNGSGKVQFCAKFPSGAVQVIATEP